MAVTRQFSESPITKRYSPEQAYQRICRYCAYQERSHKEVRNKLYGYGLHRGDVEEAITRLITDGFLNEERFAKAFAGGKFRIKSWGRNKIVHALEGHGVTPKCIQRGMREIDNSDYLKSLRRLVSRKLGEIQEANAFKRRDKAAKYAIGKGYEPDLVWATIKDLGGE